MCIHDINFEFEKLEPTEGVDCAHAATAMLHKDWLDIKSVDVNVHKSLSNLFLSGWAQKEKLEIQRRLQERRAGEAFKRYYNQGKPRKGDHQADLIQICQM